MCSISVNAQSWTDPNYYTKLYMPKPVVYPTVINHNHYCKNSSQFNNSNPDLIGNLFGSLISGIARVSANKKHKRKIKHKRKRKIRTYNFSRSYTYSR